jgi:TRAP-type transport system periplasmic protein
LRLATYELEGLDVAEFVEAVDRLSDGSLRIDVRGRWRHDRIDYETETVGDVRRGKVDLGEIGVRAFDRVGVTDFQALVAPFSIDSYELERKVLASDLPDRMLSSLRRVGVVGIGVLPGALRKPLGVSRALIAPSDYRDATIGIRPSGGAARTFRALGGRARVYVAGTDISSLDGIEVDLGRIEGDRHDGPARAVTLNVNLWPRAVALVMNPKVYSGLTSEQRETLHRAAREALAPSMKRLTGDETDALEVMCARRQMAFRSASPSQLADLRAAVRPVYRQLEKTERLPAQSTRSQPYESRRMQSRLRVAAAKRRPAEQRSRLQSMGSTR